jgi:ADP-ribosylglycohydrolase
MKNYSGNSGNYSWTRSSFRLQQGWNIFEFIIFVAFLVFIGFTVSVFTGRTDIILGVIAGCIVFLHLYGIICRVGGWIANLQTLSPSAIAGAESALLKDRIAGILIGTAVGDAIGLPYEGLSRRRAKRLLSGKLRHRLFFGRGMVSDDTEHTFMAAQTLLDEADDAARFAKKLAWRLRWWFLRLPAGIGMASLKACLKLWCGFSPQHSGVFSAGNGAAMRAAIFGAVFADARKRAAFVAASTRLTHTDPKALTGALAVADIAALSIQRNPAQLPPLNEIIRTLHASMPSDEVWRGQVEQMRLAWQENVSVIDFADRLGLQKGVSGYVYHTAPVAIYAWYRHFGDFQGTLESVIECGGDTDTVAAIAGALAGAAFGVTGIPKNWMDGICDTPINVALLQKTAEQLGRLVQTGQSPGRVRCLWPLSIPRNLFFLLLVLWHGFRRLAPPY